jgi:hypothetical protein
MEDKTQEVKKSIIALADALSMARKTLEQEGKLEYLPRLNVYEDILDQQELTLKNLETAYAKDDWENIDRTSQIIAGLSELIKQDSKELISEIRGNKIEIDPDNLH